MAITHRAYARIGLLGNPSDGFFGKTIAVSLENFFAQVTLTPSDKIRFTPHPEHDLADLDSIHQLADRVSKQGYHGGVRLLQALCVKFRAFCAAKGVPLSAPPFTLQYDTNIPKQAGLSGSSAIICAALKCLMDHYAVKDSLPKAELPGLILSAETELGITAGLQDRVIQVYEGMVYMDFEKGRMEARGYGEYVPLPLTHLPPLYIIYADNPGDSGKMHSTVKQRWDAGDILVRTGMQVVASVAARGRALLDGVGAAGGGSDTAEAEAEALALALGKLMDENFALRRKMYTDAALGALNIRMVTVATECGASAKFTGSGGCAVCVCPLGAVQVEAVRAACEREGFVMLDVAVHSPPPGAAGAEMSRRSETTDDASSLSRALAGLV